MASSTVPRARAVIDENGVTLRHLELDPTVDYQGRVRDIV